MPQERLRVSGADPALSDSMYPVAKRGGLILRAGSNPEIRLQKHPTTYAGISAQMPAPSTN